jgi:hypothetical protein
VSDLKGTTDAPEWTRPTTDRQVDKAPSLMHTRKIGPGASESGLRESLPDGCSAYLAGVSPDGSAWREISVWDSTSQAKEFMDAVLRPAIERAGTTPIWGSPPTS